MFSGCQFSLAFLYGSVIAFALLPSAASAQEITADNAEEKCFENMPGNADADMVEENQRLLEESVIDRTLIERDSFERRCVVAYFSPDGGYYRWDGDGLIEGYWRYRGPVLCTAYTAMMGRKKPTPFGVANKGTVKTYLQTATDNALGDVFSLASGAAPGAYDGKACLSIDETLAAMAPAAGEEQDQ